MRDEINALPEEAVLHAYSAEDLCVHYFTGRAISSGSGRYKTTQYRMGIMTNAGDIEESIWHELARDYVKHHNGEARVAELKQTALNTCAWIRTDEEAENHALRKYISECADKEKDGIHDE